MTRPGPLKRRSPMPRSAQPLRSAPLRRVGKRGRAKQREWADTCAERLKACGGHCERCLRVAHLHGHHKFARSQGGGNGARNCAMLCDGCHTWVHEHPLLAYAAGWLKRRNG